MKTGFSARDEFLNIIIIILLVGFHVSLLNIFNKRKVHYQGISNDDRQIIHLRTV